MVRKTASNDEEGDRGVGDVVLVDVDGFVADVLPRLVRALTVHTGDRSVAEELSQEAMARTLANWQNVALMDHPAGWVHRVAFNLAASRWRRLGALRRAEARLQPPSAAVPLFAAETIALRDAIADLSRREREVIVLRYYAGFDVGQTAGALGIASSTVTTLTSRALAKLRTEFDDAGR